MENRLKTLALAAASAGVLMAAGPVQAQDAPTEFGAADLDGAYVGTLSGYVQPDPTNPFQIVPIATLVRYCADGQGNASVAITQNIAGACIQQGTGSGTYTVNTDGTGTATATVTTTEVSPSCALLTPPVEVGAQATYQTQFVIDGAGALHNLTTSLEVPIAPDSSVSLPIVLTGTSAPQGACAVAPPQPQ